MRGGRRQRGVALAIVVWFLAAMSLLVAGIVYQARVDVRMAQIHVAQARVEAAGDGATRLMLAALASGQLQRQGEAQTFSGEFRVGDDLVRVELVPQAGLININGAPAELLAELFAGPGGLQPGDAQQLALSVVQWRATGSGRRALGGGMSQFDTVEDLLKVNGVSRTLLDNIRDYIAAPGPGGAGLDWMAAPSALLERFRDRHPQQVAAALKRREKLADLTAPGSSRASGAGAGPVGAGGNFRVDATVMYGDKPWLRRSWVALGNNVRSALPWQVIRVEAPRVRIAG